MFKALLKKQFSELGAFYMTNKKTGKTRSKKGTVGLLILFGFILFSVAMAFFGMAALLGGTFFPLEMYWLYFALFGLIATAIGTIGSVFSTYSTLYNAKDNELLLSMPLPPSTILGVRMVSVYFNAFIFSAVAWIPAWIMYFIEVEQSITGIIFPIVLTFIIPLLVTVLSCILGWVVALVAGRLKNKTFVTVALTVLLLAGYYYFYFNINKYLQMLVMYGDQVGNAIKRWVYPVYQLGRGASGEVVPMIIFTAIVLAAFALCMIILSKTFIRIVTTNRGAAKSEYKERKAKLTSVNGALLNREIRRFLGSPTYMLNAGLGLLIMPALAIFVAAKSADLNAALDSISAELPFIVKAVPAVAAAAIAMIASMDVFTAPSISLEGKSLWIVRSLPVETKDVLHAKERIHMLFNLIPCVISTAVVGAFIHADVLTIAAMIAVVCAFVWLSAVSGLVLNLKKPVLDWSSEAVPVKQSSSVVIVLFGGWIVALALAGGGIGLSLFMPLWAYMFVCAAIFAGLSILIKRWIDTKGVEVFENL